MRRSDALEHPYAHCTSPQITMPPRGWIDQLLGLLCCIPRRRPSSRIRFFCHSNLTCLSDRLSLVSLSVWVLPVAHRPIPTAGLSLRLLPCVAPYRFPPSFLPWFVVPGFAGPRETNDGRPSSKAFVQSIWHHSLSPPVRYTCSSFALT